MTVAPSDPPSMDPTSIEEEDHTIAGILEDVAQEANSQAFVHIRGGQCENRIGVNFGDAMSHEHGVYSTGTDYRDSELQLERIYIYFNEVTSVCYVP